MASGWSIVLSAELNLTKLKIHTKTHNNHYIHMYKHGSFLIIMSYNLVLTSACPIKYTRHAFLYSKSTKLATVRMLIDCKLKIFYDFNFHTNFW